MKDKPVPRRTVWLIDALLILGGILIISGMADDGVPLPLALTAGVVVTGSGAGCCEWISRRGRQRQ